MLQNKKFIKKTQIGDLPKGNILPVNLRKNIPLKFNTSRGAIQSGITNNPFEVFDFYSDAVYMFVNEASVREHLSLGFDFFPASEMASESGMGKPWMRHFSSDSEGYVVVGHDVMMYASKEVQDGRRRARLDRWNKKLDDPIKTGKVDFGQNPDDKATYSVEGERGFEEMLLENPNEDDEEIE